MKIRVAVVMGGHTSEYEISLKSGAVVMAHLDQNKYEAYAVRVTDNVWSVGVNNLWRPIDKETFSSGDLHFDVVFNAVHGAPGENGVLQSYFDNLGIPYSGCSSSASALTYDKAKTLDYLESHDIAMAKHLVIDASAVVDTKAIVSSVGLPCFVKANQSGSSFGVSKVYKEEALLKAIALAFKEDDSVLIESFLEGTEVSIGVITYQGSVLVLAPTEIVTDEDFFDFSAKYEGKSEEITPARLTDVQRKNVEIAAKKVYTALRMKGLSRSDFIFVGDTPYFLEINTVPGLTKESLLPQQAKHAGISLQQLFDNALVEAIEK
ncbi:MAG: D-alanine--D-alanine ligase [Flavobacteriaceae bacterium]|nr:D-alanine--D-alanine ligase [Flavobacteriaceae bacterium]